MKLKAYLSKYIKEFENASVVDKEIGRFSKSLTHFFPGIMSLMCVIPYSELAHLMFCWSNLHNHLDDNALLTISLYLTP